MQIIRVGIVIALIVSQVAMVPFARAASSSVMISQLQTGGAGTGTAGQEFVELYNNSDTDIMITNWYITYSSASDVSQPVVYRVSVPDQQTAVWLKAKSFALFVSPDFKTATNTGGDGVFTYTNGLSGTSGHIRVYDASNNEIDKVAWGPTAVVPPENTAPAPQGGKSLKRLGLPVLQDTDVYSADFSIGSPELHPSGIYEVVTIIDVCSNVEGAQQAVPAGMVGVGSDCYVDVCPNIAGIQSEVPVGIAKNTDGDCVSDACANITGIQPNIPGGYESTGMYLCEAVAYPLYVTELLPNPEGSDGNNEYVELYNPNTFPVDTTGYVLSVGSNFEKQYAVPAVVIPAGTYAALTNAAVGFTLVNTQSRVRVVAPSGDIVGETPLYDSPKDGEAWANIDGTWEYTNRPTPGETNMPSLQDEETNTNPSRNPAACAAGKYRHPLTNRCRNIDTDTAVLSTCDADQFRNPETGRCKKVTSVTIAPCKDGQYRSEETNRCRAIVTASTQKPCKDNQYRSEETGRCRTMAATSVPESSFAVQPVKEGAMAFVGWWALGGVGLLAAGYAGWEWRSEIVTSVRKVASVFSGRK